MSTFSSKALRLLFYLLVIRPAAYFLIGLRVRGRPNPPPEGPAIIAANHNSHVDTVIMMALFPLRQLKHIRPVAAADYWLANRRIAWFAREIIGIVPVDRSTKSSLGDPLQACYDALDQDDILIFFPEGSRGEPDKMQPFKAGISHVARKYPTVPVVPVTLKGTGRAWPRGTSVIVPHQCDVWIQKPLYWLGAKELFLTQLQHNVQHPT